MPPRFGENQETGPVESWTSSVVFVPASTWRRPTWAPASTWRRLDLGDGLDTRDLGEPGLDTCDLGEPGLDPRPGRARRRTATWASPASTRDLGDRYGNVVFESEEDTPLALAFDGTILTRGPVARTPK